MIPKETELQKPYYQGKTALENPVCLIGYDPETGIPCTRGEYVYCQEDLDRLKENFPHHIIRDDQIDADHMDADMVPVVKIIDGKIVNVHAIERKERAKRMALAEVDRRTNQFFTGQHESKLINMALSAMAAGKQLPPEYKSFKQARETFLQYRQQAKDAVLAAKSEDEVNQAMGAWNGQDK
jgi:hypothetical protein